MTDREQLRDIEFEDSRPHRICRAQAAHRGRPADGEFGATHVTVRDGSRWRFAGQHLSSIGGPPPIASA